MKLTFYNSQKIKDIAKDLSRADLNVCSYKQRLACQRVLKDPQSAGYIEFHTTVECFKTCRKIEIEIRRAK